MNLFEGLFLIMAYLELIGQKDYPMWVYAVLGILGLTVRSIDRRKSHGEDENKGR